MFNPILIGFRYFNNIASAYLAGQVGLKVWKEFRKMQQEKLTAKQLRDRFSQKYEQEHGSPPSEELVKIALDTYDAVERPLRKRIADAGQAIAGKFNKIKSAIIESKVESKVERIELVKIIADDNSFEEHIQDLNLCFLEDSMSAVDLSMLRKAFGDCNTVWTVESIDEEEGFILSYKGIETPFYIDQQYVRPFEK